MTRSWVSALRWLQALLNDLLISWCTSSNSRWVQSWRQQQKELSRQSCTFAKWWNDRLKLGSWQAVLVAMLMYCADPTLSVWALTWHTRP